MRHPPHQHPALVVVHHLPAALDPAIWRCHSSAGEWYRLGPPGASFAALLVGDAVAVSWPFEPRPRATRPAHVARERGRHAVGEAADEVPAGAAEERRTACLPVARGVRGGGANEGGHGAGRTGERAADPASAGASVMGGSGGGIRGGGLDGGRPSRRGRGAGRGQLDPGGKTGTGG